MGIRYYAYTFPAEATEAALDNPRSFIGSDPFADAWGMEPGERCGHASGMQRPPKEELLYLDKAWRDLQGLTRPRYPGEPRRPAYRMVEGDVAFTSTGWIPWVRALSPTWLPEIAADLAALQREARRTVTDEYVLEYLQHAAAFTAHLASVGRGFVYLIG
ncbi:hypothetical protein [Demequina mangrovi]|uniref:DUF1877 domain-containing protein n=1 Tax=Demequina mangrovi TaxID=1043493 RepID=A0A1H6ZSP2_9MICO|nr:hypothetical protein [Demequina mangrovi]SEJ51785.1 hypothetical protein SAMN05421637_2109 [Demequina mangrovi]